MAEKADIVIQEETIKLLRTDASPVVHVEGGHWDLDEGDGDVRIGDDENMIKMGVSTGGGGAGNGRIRATSDLRLGGGDETVVSIDNEGIYPQNGNRDLGKRVNPWRTGYMTHLVSEDVFGSETLKLGHEDGVVLSIDNDGFDGNVRPEKDNVKLGTSAHRWLETYTGRSDVNHLKVNEGVVSSLIPKGIAVDINSDAGGEEDFEGAGALPPTEVGEEGAVPALGSEDSPWSAVYAEEVIAEKTTTPSDRRLKTDIKDFRGGLDAVLDLRPVSYSWRDNGDETTFGLVGQEVADVLPEVVDVPKNDDEYFGLDYSDLVPVLIDAVQDQHAELEDLKEKVDRQQGRIEEQQEQIDELQDRVATLE